MGEGESEHTCLLKRLCPDCRNLVLRSRDVTGGGGCISRPIASWLSQKREGEWGREEGGCRERKRKHENHPVSSESWAAVMQLLVLNSAQLPSPTQVPISSQNAPTSQLLPQPRHPIFPTHCAQNNQVLFCNPTSVISRGFSSIQGSPPPVTLRVRFLGLP